VRLHRPGFDVLTVLCAVLLLVHVGVVMLGGFDPNNRVTAGLYDWLGLSREGMVHWRIWQLGTHAFLHGNWLHFIPNVLVVYMIGGRVMHIIGRRGFALVFGGGVLLAAILHLLFHPANPMGTGAAVHSPLVGASGGAMALLLVLTSLSPDSKMWPLPVSGKNLGRGLLLASLLLFLVTPGLGIPGLSGIGRWLMSFGEVEAEGVAPIFQIGHIYHFGGGLMGLLYGRWLLRRPITLAELQRRRAKREGLAA
jgi:membrane associated rhomboid family serine protease